MEPALHALPQGFSSAPSPLAKAPASPPPTPPSSGDENSDQFAWKRLDKGKGREVPAGGTPTESVSAGVAAPLQPQLSKEFAQARSLLLSKVSVSHSIPFRFAAPARICVGGPERLNALLFRDLERWQLTSPRHP